MASSSVIVEGDFVSAGSLAIVNRGWFGEIARRGSVELAIRAEPTAMPIPGRAGELLEPLRARRLDDADVTVRHLWPPRTTNVRRGAYVQVQPWEFGALPRAWLAWREVADEIWCYSSFVARAYLDAGFAPEHVHVIPLGFDPQAYFPKKTAPVIPTGRRCVFLFVGATIRRKGVDVLVNAYLNAFKPTDDVALIVKDVDPGGVYRGQSIAAQIRSFSNPSLARLVYSAHVFPDEAAMADLYRSATCLVHPYRGEGFGLPVLEAMACGLPVIVTRGGATDDFVSRECGFLVDAKRVSAGFVTSEELAGEPWLLEPDIHQLIDAMRQVYDNPDDARARGQQAAARAGSAWTWDHAARRIEERLSALHVTGTSAPKRQAAAPALVQFEAKIASQNGEDGILLELFRRVGVAEPFFVEFGVGDGLECNTRHLATTLVWRGVMLESDPDACARLRENYRERPNTTVVCASITRENACDVFAGAGIPAEFDLLSIDIDGNDYWVWEALGTAYRPRVVVIETNGAYPPPRRWVMAYDPQHVWRGDNYYGASLESLAHLGERLGYVLLGMESAGVNAFFVREDLLNAAGFPALSAAAAYRPQRYVHPAADGPFVEA